MAEDRLNKIREAHPHCDKALSKALETLPGRSLPCDMCWMITEIETLRSVLGHLVALYEYDNGSMDISMQNEIYRMAVKVLPVEYVEKAIGDPDAFLLTAEELLGSEQEGKAS